MIRMINRPTDWLAGWLPVRSNYFTFRRWNRRKREANMRNESTDFKYFVPKCRIQSNSRLIIFIFRVGIWNGLMNRSVIGFFGKMSSQISGIGRLSQISVPLFWRLLSSNAILFESAILSSVLWVTPSALVPLLIISGWFSRLDLTRLAKNKHSHTHKSQTNPRLQSKYCSF